MIPKPITLTLTQKELDFIETMAIDIHSCRTRSRGRSYEQVYLATKAGVILEFALERQGAKKNPRPWRVSDRESYAWDVLWNNKKTEVKRKRFLTDDRTSWYSWNDPSYVKTFLKNTDLVQQLIIGDYREIEEDTYEVKWMLMTDVGRDFRNYIKKSMYNLGQMYYNHKQDPNCNYLM